MSEQTRRSRAALVGAAVVGFTMLLTTMCATAEPVQETPSSPSVTPERTSPGIADLAPEIQVDLHLVQTDAYIEDQDYAAARDAMGKIVDLQRNHELELPDEFHFKHAQVLHWAESHAEAVESFLRYLELTGRSGTHYREALELLHESLEAQTVANERMVPGERFQDCGDCPEMVVVPAGSYLMGSPSSEEGRDDDEGPQHEVTIREPFAVGVYEVTFEEWAACVNAGGCGRYRPDDQWGRGKRPVMYVSAEDAALFVEWLREVTGEPYRLLSESEWEYVARAGTNTPFHTGGTVSPTQANYNGNHAYGSGTTGRYRGRAMPVGTFEPNAFGLHDVHGNVGEWVEDCWNDSYRGAPSDGSAWERGDCSRRVMRGGSWHDPPRDVRSANRQGFGSADRPEYRGNIIGFRVARSLAP